LISKIIIWDLPGLLAFLPAKKDKVVLWKRHKSKKESHYISVLDLAEKKSLHFRRRYLGWVWKIGYSKIGQISSIDRLKLRPDFSMWWMTGLAEKCNIDRSPQINQAILLLAFADWMKGRNENKIWLFTHDPALAKCLDMWTKANGIELCLKKNVVLKASQNGLRRFCLKLFLQLRALRFLSKKILTRKALRGVGLAAWKSTKGSLTFVNYLFNQDIQRCRNGFLESPFWGKLPKILQKKGIKTNWLHLYVEDSRLPTATDATRLLGSFNKHGAGTQTHVTLDSFISGAVLWQTLRDWWRLQRASRGVSWEACFPKIEGFDFYPLFQEEWQESLSGSPAISNLLSLNLFEAALQALPRQKLGVYLQENLAWETAMLTAWRQSGHGKIIGFPHSTIRFWDLRYFHDSKELVQRLPNGRPRPDYLAVNGPHTRNLLREGGFSNKHLVDVEALRNPQKIKPLVIPKTRIPRRRSDGPNIVIFGDYAETHTRNQMELLHSVADRIPPGAEIVARPHPACPIRTKDYPNLSFSVSSQSMDELLAWADLVYASPTTTAALDAFSLGIPVIVPVAKSNLNLSPLRGICTKCFVKDKDQLAKALTGTKGKKNGYHKNLFTSNPRLPKWKKLLCQQKKTTIKKFY